MYIHGDEVNTVMSSSEWRAILTIHKQQLENSFVSICDDLHTHTHTHAQGSRFLLNDPVTDGQISHTVLDM